MAFCTFYTYERAVANKHSIQNKHEVDFCRHTTTHELTICELRSKYTTQVHNMYVLFCVYICIIENVTPFSS